MTLEQRLARIFPALAGTAFTVESTELAGNAWNTRFVRRHRVLPQDGQVLECVEKKLVKVLGVAPYEPRMQALAACLDGAARLIHVPHLGAIDTPLACFVYSQLVAGPHAHLGRIGARAGHGLAQMETLSMPQVQALPAAERARLDFFRPFTRWRPRYNLALAVGRPQLRHASLRGIRAIAMRLRPPLRALALDARASAPCLSHLDLLAKNFIEQEQRLHLIDWGEARVGRVGFDAGSYLHRLLRANDMATFERWGGDFMDSYLAHLAPEHVAAAQRNATYFLALRTLCYFLRPDVLRRHRDAPGPVEGKLAMLLAQAERAAAR